MAEEMNATQDTQALTKRRADPALVQVGNRALATDGRVHPNLMSDYLRNNARNAWVDLKTLTRQLTGSLTKSNRNRIVRHLPDVARDLLKHDQELLICEYQGRSIIAVKFLDIESEQDRQYARATLTKMRRRADVTAEQYEAAIQAIELKEHLAKKDE